MSVELQKKNKVLLDRFKTMGEKQRFAIPEYIAHQRNEGVSLETIRHETKGRGRGPSQREQIANKVRFSKSLLLHSTFAQVKAYQRKVADQIIANRKVKARGVSA